MKVLYVANVAAEHICKFYVNEFRELKKLGWTIDVACHADAPIEYADHVFPMPWNRNPFSISILTGIHKVKKLIKENSYDMVYCTTPIGGFVGRLAAKHVHSYHPAVLYFCHGFHFYKGCNPLRWVIFYPIEKYLSRFTDTLITINHEDYLLATKHLKAKKVCFSNGIGANVGLYANLSMTDQEKQMLKQSLGLENSYPVLFYAAEISRLKNQVMLLQVVKDLKKKGLKPALLLAGRDRTKGSFEKIVKKEHLTENVQLLGFRRDCAQLLRISDFCTPSSRREGLPLNVVEAMAARTPVVALRNRGHIELLSDPNYGFLVSDADQMCEVITSSTKEELAAIKEKAFNYKFLFAHEGRI
jgi:glycosyltransferase EpsD